MPLTTAGSKIRDEFSHARDVVFSPNLVVSPRFDDVYKKFMARRGKRTLESWTCKKTAQPGDLYLFYFAHPVEQILGLAVCSGFPDLEGKLLSEGQRMFFCPFDRLHHFDSPISAEELRSDLLTDSWWSSKPYRGRPKSIPDAVASALLELITAHEPAATGLLDEFIKRSQTDTGTQEPFTIARALEGTMRERLSRSPVRSKALRDAKIRKVLNATGRLACEVPGCAFDFRATYGELGRGFAHVHHRRSLAKRDNSSHTTLDDLAIVCANCHAMLHQWGECRRVEDLVVAKPTRRR